MRIQFIIITLLGLMLAACGSKEADAPATPTALKAQLAPFEKTPLFKAAVDYNSIPRVKGCEDEVPREIKYHNCRDSKLIYTRALGTANAMNKPLMVIFGFNKCPYCIKLESEIMNPRNPLRSHDVAQYFSKAAFETYQAEQDSVKIPFVRLHARADHGLALADELGITEMAEAAGWHRVWSPFVVFVNPKTGEMSSESEWEAKEIYCDWAAGVATSLEKIDMTEAGKPVTERKRCPKA